MESTDSVIIVRTLQGTHNTDTTMLPAPGRGRPWLIISASGMHGCYRTCFGGLFPLSPSVQILVDEGEMGPLLCVREEAESASSWAGCGSVEMRSEPLQMVAVWLIRMRRLSFPLKNPDALGCWPSQFGFLMTRSLSLGTFPLNWETVIRCQPRKRVVFS